jgi:MoxR-like ATPase
MHTNEIVLGMEQIVKLVATSGHLKTYIVEGPAGSGKSSIVNLAKNMFGDKFNYVVIDCTQWDVGDVQIPDVDKVNLVTRFVPNVLLVGDGTKPMFILLDEIGKASRPVQNALLPVMLERRAGMRPLPAGSIVFGATNLGAEGMGDLFQPHARNRVSFLKMRSPTSEEWINNFALHNDVPPEVMAFANKNPQLFHSFEQYTNPDDNLDIFHPKQQRKSFVTARSLYLASIELRPEVRAAVGDSDATFAAIAGNIGAHAAANLMAFVELADKMPSWESIVHSPATALLPEDSPAAMCLVVFSMVARFDKTTLPSVITYMKRLPTEIQCMFATQVMRSPRGGLAASHRPFTDWCISNHWAMK